SFRVPPKAPKAVRLAPTIQISRERVLAIFLFLVSGHPRGHRPLGGTSPRSARLAVEHAFFVGDDLAGDGGGGDVERRGQVELSRPRAVLIVAVDGRDRDLLRRRGDAGATTDTGAAAGR